MHQGTSLLSSLHALNATNDWERVHRLLTNITPPDVAYAAMLDPGILAALATQLDTALVARWHDVDPAVLSILTQLQAQGQADLVDVRCISSTPASPPTHNRWWRVPLASRSTGPSAWCTQSHSSATPSHGACCKYARPILDTIHIESIRWCR